MGRTGPIPKRSDQGHRTNQAIKRKRGARPTDSGLADMQVVDPSTGLVRVGPLTFIPDSSWHPVARMVWDAAINTPGVMRYYQPTDLAVLYSVCDDMSYYKQDMEQRGRVPAAALASLNTLLTSLMLTEGDRRRANIELTNSGPSKDNELERSEAVKLLSSYMEDRQ